MMLGFGHNMASSEEGLRVCFGHISSSLLLHHMRQGINGF